MKKSYCKILLVGMLTLSFYFKCHSQFSLNINNRFGPAISIDGKKKELKSLFKQYKKQKINLLDQQIDSLEVLQKLPADSLLDIFQLYQMRTDSISALNATNGDSASINPIFLDSAKQNLDRSISNSNFGSAYTVQQQLANKIDSLQSTLKNIDWKKVEEQFISQRMQSFLLEKGHIDLPENSNHLQELKNSMINLPEGISLNPDELKTAEGLSEESAKQLQRLKKKYIKVDDLHKPGEGAVERPKPYKEVLDRLVVGGQVNVTLDRQSKISLMPSLGVFISRRIRLNFDYSVDYVFTDEWVYLEKNNEKKPRIGSFVDLDLTRNIFLRSKAEYFPGGDLVNIRSYDFYVGVGRSFTIKDRLKGVMVVNYSLQPNPQGRRFFFEYGIQQRGISNIFSRQK
jgi:hypothetical protein